MTLIDSAARLSTAALDAATWRPDAATPTLQRAPVADGVGRMLEAVRAALDGVRPARARRMRRADVSWSPAKTVSMSAGTGTPTSCSCIARPTVVTRSSCT